MSLFSKGRTPAAFLVLVSLLWSSIHAQQISVKKAFPALKFAGAVDIQQPGDGTNRLFIVRQRGIIEVVENNQATAVKKTFLNIDPVVISGGELGLLGLAFHPDYDSNGYFFVNYTRDSSLRTVVSRFKVSMSNPDSADRSSELIFMEVPQPYTNHNGGQLAFDQDGYLYIAMGDGGSGGDPENNGQDRTALLGKILRIDVDTPDDTLNYSIPPGNPFAGNVDGYREEIFAWGLRNPWRFSFDPLTGGGWIADVGQHLWEEIDVLANGANYGWRLKEADHCYDPPSGCDTIPGLTDPLWEYPHVEGEECSVTGGYVYRGDSIPSLYGKYIYGDYCTGRIWTLDTNGLGQPTNTLLLEPGLTITTFGIDRDNELYISSVGDSSIYKLILLSPPAPVLISPPDSSTNVPPDPELVWHSASAATAYHLQVAQDEAFTMILRSDTALTDTSDIHLTDSSITTYFWRVRARNTEGWGSFSPGWWFSTTDLFTGFYGVDAGWNIISIPLDIEEGPVDSLFPTAISSAFEFHPKQGYLARDTLVPGPGCWLKFAGPETIPISGTVRESDTVEVLAGWNLLGGLSSAVDIDSVFAEPPGIIESPFYLYDGSYQPAASLEPMRGYWVKTSAPGVMILRSED